MTPIEALADGNEVRPQLRILRTPHGGKPHLYSMHRDRNGLLWMTIAIDDLPSAQGADSYRVMFQSEQHERTNHPGIVCLESAFLAMYESEGFEPV